MSLSPIQMFQNNGSNSIEGLLRAGPEAISNIMNQAIQIGRSMSDKQLAQERDLFAMRDRETQMMQRRAENLESSNKDALRFGRAAFESDRRFRAETGDELFNRDRVTANDVFSQGIDERQMGLSEEKFDYEKGLAEEEHQRRISAQQAFDAGMGTPTESPKTFTEQSALSDERDWASRGAKPVQATAESTYSDGNVDTTTQVPKAGFNAQSMFGTPAQSEASADPVEAMVRRQSQLSAAAGNTDLTPSQRAAAEEEAAILSRRIKQADKGGNESPKEPSAASEDKEIGMLFKNKRFFPAPGTPDTELYEKDKETNELNSAFGMKKDEYIGKVKNPDAAAARGRVWEYAQKRLGGKSGVAGTPSTGGNSDLDWLRD